MPEERHVLKVLDRIPFVCTDDSTINKNQVRDREKPEFGRSERSIRAAVSK